MEHTATKTSLHATGNGAALEEHIATLISDSALVLLWLPQWGALWATAAWWWPCPEHRADLHLHTAGESSTTWVTQTCPCESSRCLLSGLEGQHSAWWNSVVNTCFQNSMFIKLWKNHSVTNRLLDLFFICLSNNSTQPEEAGGAQVSIWTCNFKKLASGKSLSERLPWYFNFYVKDLIPARATSPANQRNVCITMSTPKDHQSALCVCPRRFTTSGAMYSMVPQNEYARLSWSMASLLRPKSAQIEAEKGLSGL